MSSQKQPFPILDSVVSFNRRATRRVEQELHNVVAPVLARSGRSPGPTTLLIQLTYKCNMRCSFCSQWGSTGSSKTLAASQLRDELPLATLQRVFDEVPLSCSGAYLWGGETLLYPEIIPLVSSIVRGGRSCWLVTNGTYLAEKAEALVETGMQTITVSIDSTEEAHDRERGQGAFQAAVEGVGRLLKYRSARAGSKLKVVVGVVLLPHSVEEAPELIRQMRALGVDRMGIERLQYATDKQGHQHEAVFQEAFQLTPTSWKGIVRQIQPGGPDKVAAVVAKLKADEELKGFLEWGAPRWNPEDYFRYYSDPTETAPRNKHCRFPWDSVCIYANGDLSPCPDYPDYIVGNIKEASFMEIWNGERFRRFRMELNDRGRFPICTSCCQLFSTDWQT